MKYITINLFSNIEMSAYKNLGPLNYIKEYGNWEMY